MHNDVVNIWLVDVDGNIGMSRFGLVLLADIKRLAVPMFTSTEQAMLWGSRLNAHQHATLLDIQRTRSNAALDEPDLQRMVELATQSQLLREAAEAVVPGFPGEKSLPFHDGGPAQPKD
jgi:hypothetical protein